MRGRHENFHSLFFPSSCSRVIPFIAAWMPSGGFLSLHLVRSDIWTVRFICFPHDAHASSATPLNFCQLPGLRYSPPKNRWHWSKMITCITCSICSSEIDFLISMQRPFKQKILYRVYNYVLPSGCSALVHAYNISFCPIVDSAH